MNKTCELLAAVALAGFLAACGGGGGSDGESGGGAGSGGGGSGGSDGGGSGGGSGGGAGGGGTVAALEGGYSVVADDGTSGRALVLEDGSFWSIGGLESGGVLAVDTLLQGPVALAGSAVSSSGLRAYGFPAGLSVTAGFSGTRAASGAVTGAVTSGAANPVSVTLTPLATAEFDYAVAATPAAIGHNWTGGFSTGDTGTVAITALGAVSSTTDDGCTFAGTATPRPSGKNVYDVSVSFGPAPCALPNGTGTGVAVITGAGAAAQLTVGVVSDDRSLGAVFIGSR